MKNILSGIIFFLLCTATGIGQQDDRSRQFNLEKGVAIQGYDPIAYFVSNQAMKGVKEYVASVGGVTYYFTSRNNQNLFLKDPKRFEPQYGGWCAYAMGMNGEKVEIDPQSFKIINGKLYLFYHSWTNNTLLKWNANEGALQIKADENWKKLVSKS